MATWVAWGKSQFATVWGVSFFLIFGSFAKATGLTVRQICSNEGSKRVVPLKEVPFRGLNDTPLSLGRNLPKTEIMGA